MILRKISRPLFAFTALAVLSASHASQGFSAKTGQYGPIDEVIVAKPVLRWQIWCDDGKKITAAAVVINGKEYPAKYLPEGRRAEFVPPAPLAPGEYVVEMKVVVEDKAVFNKSWKLKIADKCLPALPEPTPLQLEFLAAANKLRRDLGLPDAVIDPALCLASERHSVYLALNNDLGHDEKAGAPGYFGDTNVHRLAKLGWSLPTLEAVNVGATPPAVCMQMLYDAAYHRLPFMQLGQVSFGAGRSKDKTTILMGGGDDEGVVISPADGQKDVPASWTPHEEPSPLRMHGVTGFAPVGIPIVVSVHQSGAIGLQAGAISLSTNGQPVPAYVNTPGNDDQLQSGLILIPKKPLKPSTKYTVKVSLKTATGTPFDRVWSFTTAAK